jgi:hypothetical protein
VNKLGNANLLVPFGELLPRLFITLRSIKNVATNSRVATDVIGTTVAMTSVLLLFLVRGDLHVEAPPLQIFVLLSILSLKRYSPNQ